MLRPELDDPDLPLTVLFNRWPKAAQVFLSRRMACFGCAFAPFHTVRDACEVYHLDEVRFRVELHGAVFVAAGPAH